MKKYFLILFTCLSSLIHCQIKDTIEIKRIYVSNISVKSLFREIKKNFKKNLITNHQNYKFNILVKDSTTSIISFSGDCEKGIEEALLKRRFPNCIEEKVKTNYFEELDKSDNPLWLLTNSGLRYINISKFLDEINTNEVVSNENESSLDFNFSFKDYNCFLRVDKINKNVIFLKIKGNKINDSSRRRSIGTSNYLNSETKYEILEMDLEINFASNEDKIYLISYKRILDIPKYELKVYQRNKENLLDKTYNYKFKSSVIIEI